MDVVGPLLPLLPTKAISCSVDIIMVFPKKPPLSAPVSMLPTREQVIAQVVTSQTLFIFWQQSDPFSERLIPTWLLTMEVE